MTNPTQHRSWILGICRRAAGAALALAIVLILAVLATRSAEAQTYTETVLNSFTGSPDGATPLKNLVRDAQGNLYGVTKNGGNPACASDGPGCGTVFKVDTMGKETLLHKFAPTGGDGTNPHAGLVLDKKGNLYGTTMLGGVACSRKPTCGTVFKVDTNGTETVIYSFTETGGDGANPEAGLVLDTKGNLYGMTVFGGAYGYGTVFKLAPPAHPGDSYLETVLYSFTGGADGGLPAAGLVRDTQGNLCGTTTAGGNLSCNAPNGCGVVFKLNTAAKETVLHSFTGTGGDGAEPYSDLVLDTQGNLYGTTELGGDLTCNAPYGCGTAFKLDPTSKETMLYSFTGTGGDGGGPVEGLARDAKGNLYGTTVYGGDLSCVGGSFPGCGVVFKLDATDKETVLHTFTKTEGDGAFPDAGLVLDANGNLYGTTSYGGDLACGAGAGCGTVFKLTVPTPTTTTLTSSPNPSAYGQAVTFTAAVTSKAGTPPNGETVSFMKGTTVLGTGTLSGGSASLTTSTLKVGTNAIKAVYAGDSNFAPSTSKAVSQVVSKATTTTTLASSLNPSKVGQSVTFTASVTPEFSGTVTGNVTFYDGTTLLKTVTLSGGAAKFTTKTLTSGTHSITATYNGSTSFTGSSASLTQTVN